MTDEAGRAYERARESDVSPEEAWDRLGALAATTDWDTAWLDDEHERSVEHSPE